MRPGAVPSYGNVEQKAIGKTIGNGAAFTASLIIADTLGAGILSTAIAVANLGWGLGVVTIALMLGLNIHTSLLLWRLYMQYPEAHTLRELVDLAMATAPRRQQKWVALTVRSSQQFGIAMMSGLYIYTIGRGLGMFFHHVQWCLPIWTLIGSCFIILPCHLYGRRFDNWQILVWINCATILATCIIPLAWMASQGAEESRPPESRFEFISSTLSVGGTISSLCIFGFGLTSQFILVEIMSEMRDAAEFPKAYAAYSGPFQLFVFLLTGVGGYYYRGHAVQGMLLDSMPFGPWFRVAAVLLVVHMVVTYLIKATVLCRELQVMVCEQGAAWSVVVVAALGFAMLVSQVVPFFTDLVDLIGATLVPFVCWVVPIAMYLRSFPQCRWHGWSTKSVEWLALMLYAALAVVLLVVGTYSAVARIVVHWGTYGGPFQCHCWNMWSTCECSAWHPGMESCPIGHIAGAP